MGLRLAAFGRRSSAIIWLLGKFCLRDTAGSPERARWFHFARSGSQSQRAVWFILPAGGASHIKENLDRSQYPFQPIKFVNLVVPSPCEMIHFM